MNLLAKSEIVAWSELVKRYGKLVYSVCYQILNNKSDAEDAVQNSFMRLKHYASKFDDSQPLKPWLARIASGEAIRIYQRKKNINKKESVRMENHNSSIELQRRDVAEIVEQQEIESLVNKAITLLPEHSRVALTLYYAGGLNQSEIADELGVSQVSISERIKLGLEKVKTYLKKAGIHAAVVLLPNLIQESLISISPSNDFILKLSKVIQADTKLISSNTKLEISSSCKKTSTWLWYLLGVFSVVTISFFFWLKKEEPKVLPIAKTINKIPEISSKKGYLPFDYSKNKYFAYRKGKSLPDNINLDTKEIDIQIKTEANNWIINNQKEKVSFKRNQEKSELADGFYFSQEFSKPQVFKGKIKVLTNEKNELGFLLKLPIDKIKKEEKILPLLAGHKNEISVAGNFSEICGINLLESAEIDFKVYVWKNKKKWLSASFIDVKGMPMPYFISGSLTHLGENFLFGFFANSKVECYDFKYWELDKDWDYSKEPDIVKVLNKFPKDFFIE